MMADHGRTEKYSHDFVGYGKRMDTLQAAVLRVKLRHLEEWTALRQEKAAAYNRLLSGVVETPFEPEWAKAVYHLYVVRVPNRDQVFSRMKEAGIGVGIHYPIPLHLQPCLLLPRLQAGRLPPYGSGGRVASSPFPCTPR